MGLVENVREDGLAGMEHNFLTGKLEDLVRWSRRRSSLMPATFGLACCAIEMMAAGGPHYDLARFGMEVFRASPRQADLMIVAGRCQPEDGPGAAHHLRPDDGTQVGHLDGRVRQHRRHVQQLRLVQGVDQVVPVDVYAPGCPPGPETLLHAIITLHGMIADGRDHAPPCRDRSRRRASRSTSSTARPRRGPGPCGRSPSGPRVMAADADAPRPRRPSDQPEPDAEPTPVETRVRRARHPVRAATWCCIPSATSYVDAGDRAARRGLLDVRRPVRRRLPRATPADRWLPAGVHARALRGRGATARPPATGRRVRLRVQVPEPTTPPCPTLFAIHPGAESHEREAYDMFGITFDGHPDMTRILMPEEWIGHPLRKDYAIGQASPCSSRAPSAR